MSESNENFRQIDSAKEQHQLLAQTALDIQLAGYEPEETIFLAAHGSTDTVIVCRHTGELMVWHVFSGTTQERKDLTERIREKFRATSR